MGGYGSGFQGAAKATTDDRLRLDVGRLAKGGTLEPGTRTNLQWTATRTGEVRGSLATEALPEALALVLVYGLNGEPRRDCIGLDWVPCRFGGVRPWFLCPRCGRRCGFLYAGTGGFRCRDCGGLAYWTTRDDPVHRHLRHAERIRKKLGWQPRIEDPSDGRPKGMHRRTYERLRTAYGEHILAHWDALDAALERHHAQIRARYPGLEV